MICRVCEEDLEPSEFHRGSSGYQTACKKCSSDYFKDWYRRNPKVCEVCGGPRSYGSERLCLACYHTEQAERATERKKHCIDCGVEITRASTRCRSCAATLLWSDPERRKAISERKKYEWEVGIMKGHPQPESMKRYMSKIMKERYGKDE